MEELQSPKHPGVYIASFMVGYFYSSKLWARTHTVQGPRKWWQIIYSGCDSFCSTPSRRLDAASEKILSGTAWSSKCACDWGLGRGNSCSMFTHKPTFDSPK